MEVIQRDAIVIGAGISGLATAKCLKDDGYDVVILEKSSDIGGLWTFREDDYGVMSFTHINVSKYNYCFSEYPFPESTPDFPHHSDMANYIHAYANNFGLLDLVRFNIKVENVEQMGEKWRVTAKKSSKKAVQASTTESSGEPQAEQGSQEEESMVFVASYVAVTTGHHAKPNYPKFPGEETFPGEILHSVHYNDAIMNKFEGQRVLVVGIGNSAVDAAVDLVTVGRCPPVHISTRSGAWVMPNYLMGFPIDLYACRFFFLLPRSVQSFVFETVVSLIQGSPWKWGLNPKMGALQTQPTVSPVLIHHIQRQHIKIVPNITKIEGRTVRFVNGQSAEFDKILYCTGYSIDLPFLPESIREKVFDPKTNEIKLFKNVFSPEIGPTLAFIGFVQPASGGVLTMSEIQARWFSSLCRGNVKLPGKMEMLANMEAEKQEAKARWYQSARHTIQRDPILYCDEIASYIGAKPEPLSHPRLAWRLLFSTCGASQYRLQGPHKWSGAAAEVKKVPVTDMWTFSSYSMIALLLLLAYLVLSTVYGCFSSLF